MLHLITKVANLAPMCVGSLVLLPGIAAACASASPSSTQGVISVVTPPVLSFDDWLFIGGSIVLPVLSYGFAKKTGKHILTAGAGMGTYNVLLPMMWDNSSISTTGHLM
jgi:hypothetical protein